MQTNPNGLLRDFNTFGYLFESMCIRDLRIYAQGLDGEICHYCDESGLEADAIITLPDGRWGAVGIKMGQRQVDEATNNLLKLRELFFILYLHDALDTISRFALGVCIFARLHRSGKNAGIIK
jgi:hypothetical protein